MAFEADCGVSTVLETLRVTSTARYDVPVLLLVVHASRVHAAGTAAPQNNPDSFALYWASVAPTRRMGDIPNS
jgi:hypothetical protein